MADGWEAPHRARAGRNESKALRRLGRDIPFSVEAERSRIRQVLRYVVTPLVVVVVVLGLVQWFRPLARPTFHPSEVAFHLPGKPLQLPMPRSGEGALAIEGSGTVGSTPHPKPVPISGLVKVMTAYLVLRDHPLSGGADGPTIPVTSSDLAAYQAEVSSQQAVVPVAAGETLTEFEALEGLLVASGNDMAVLLANWDAGTTVAFVAKMNATASSLGLRATHFTDPSGADDGSVSTPADMIRLGEAAMSIATFRTIVAFPQTTLPLAGTVYNLDTNLGQGGFLGIKTGADTVAGGCYLFAAEQSVGGSQVTLFGAVLDQQTPTPTTSALFAAYLMAEDTFADLRAFPAATARVGRIDAPWGASIPVEAAAARPIVGLPGQVLSVRYRIGPLPTAIAGGEQVGELVVEAGGQRRSMTLRAGRRLPGPSATWRLTRLP